MDAKIYIAKWFDHLWWAYREQEILATSEEMVREYLDKECAPQFRAKPYQKEDTDSLTIKEDCDIVFPHVLKEYGHHG